MTRVKRSLPCNEFKYTYNTYYSIRKMKTVNKYLVKYKEINYEMFKCQRNEKRHFSNPFFFLQYSQISSIQNEYLSDCLKCDRHLWWVLTGVQADSFSEHNCCCTMALSLSISSSLGTLDSRISQQQGSCRNKNILLRLLLTGLLIETTEMFG